jgi:hypothetical protein
MGLSLALSVGWHGVSGWPKGERECTLSSRIRELTRERLTVSSKSRVREERVFYFTSSVESIWNVMRRDAEGTSRADNSRSLKHLRA